MDKKIPIDEDVKHVVGICVSGDIFTYEGVGPKGIYYVGGKLSTGEILSKTLWKPKGKIDFGLRGQDSFSEVSSICEARRVDKIVGLEMQTGVDYSHLENLIGMPWEQIYSVLNDARCRSQLEEVNLVDLKLAA